MIYKIFNNLTG